MTWNSFDTIFLDYLKKYPVFLNRYHYALYFNNLITLIIIYSIGHMFSGNIAKNLYFFSKITKLVPNAQ